MMGYYDGDNNLGARGVLRDYKGNFLGTLR